MSQPVEFRARCSILAPSNCSITDLSVSVLDSVEFGGPAQPKPEGNRPARVEQLGTEKGDETATVTTSILNRARRGVTAMDPMRHVDPAGNLPIRGHRVT